MSEVPCRKRDDYLEWPEYFMAVAFLSAQRSKDPNSQVGACIVNAENKIVGIGYNGMPNGCSDDLLPWRRTAENILDTKYPYVCHAELNAIMNKNSADVKGCTMYVALFPCNECAKLIIQAGIKEVIFMSDKYHDSNETTAARLMFEMAGISFRKFTPKCSQIVIDFDSINSRPSQKLQFCTPDSGAFVTWLLANIIKIVLESAIPRFVISPAWREIAFCKSWSKEQKHLFLSSWGDSHSHRHNEGIVSCDFYKVWGKPI